MRLVRDFKMGLQNFKRKYLIYIQGENITYEKII